MLSPFLWSLVFNTSYLSQQIGHCQLLLTKKKERIPLADDGKSFDSCIDEVRAMVPIESSVITSVVPCCILFAGCGVCKRMQPIFQQAATETKGKYVSLLNLALPHTQSTVLLHHRTDLQLSSSVMFAD